MDSIVTCNICNENMSKLRNFMTLDSKYTCHVTCFLKNFVNEKIVLTNIPDEDNMVLEDIANEDDMVLEDIPDEDKMILEDIATPATFVCNNSSICNTPSPRKRKEIPPSIHEERKQKQMEIKKMNDHLRRQLFMELRIGDY